MSYLPKCRVCKKGYETWGWLGRHYESEHPEFLNEENGDTSPNRRVNAGPSWPVGASLTHSALQTRSGRVGINPCDQLGAMDSQENVTPTDTAGFKRRLSKQQQVQEQVQEQKRQRTENNPATPMIPTHPNTQRHASLHPRIQAMMVTQKGSGGSIHLTIHVSRSEDYTSTYLGIAAHWLDRGFHFKEVVLELVCVKQGSENLAHSVMKCLGSYGTADCVGCITTLNTDDNLRSEPTIMTMLQFLEQQLAASTWTMKDHHVHCMEHLVNIAGQQMVPELEGNAERDRQRCSPKCGAVASVNQAG